MNCVPPAPAADTRAAEWIAPRLTGAWGSVTGAIPAGYPAYARVLHPIDPDLGPSAARWRDIAAENGRTMHALAQWRRISVRQGVDPDSSVARDQPDPEAGNLDPRRLRALCDVLGRHARPGTPCWFAVWVGWGELHPSAGTSFAQQAPDEWQLDVQAAPTFELPHREYALFTGGIDAALRIGRWATRDWFLPRSPQLFWPDDRAWCVATEIDFDSTLVGGSEALIADVLACADLEAWPIAPDASLRSDADTVNPA